VDGIDADDVPTEYIPELYDSSKNANVYGIGANVFGPVNISDVTYI